MWLLIVASCSAAASSRSPLASSAPTRVLPASAIVFHSAVVRRFAASLVGMRSPCVSATLCGRRARRYNGVSESSPLIIVICLLVILLISFFGRVEHIVHPSVGYISDSPRCLAQVFVASARMRQAHPAPPHGTKVIFVDTTLLAVPSDRPWPMPCCHARSVWCLPLCCTRSVPV